VEECRPSTLSYAAVTLNQNMAARLAEPAESNAMSFDLIGKLHSSKLGNDRDVEGRSIVLTLFSRNCLLSQRSCKYLTTLSAESSTSVPALTWPSTADHSCQRWKDSGEPPFPFLQLPKTPSWHNLSLENLRHMHHLALLASVLELSKTRQFCLWWSEFKMYVRAIA
jgi:hypothetical protein